MNLVTPEELVGLKQTWLAWNSYADEDIEPVNQETDNYFRLICTLEAAFMEGFLGSQIRAL